MKQCDGLGDAAEEGLVALLGSIGKKGAKAAASDDDEDPEDAGSEPGGAKQSASDATSELRTAHLLFLSRQEIEAVASFAKEKADALSKVFKKKKPDADTIKKLRKDLH